MNIPGRTYRPTSLSWPSISFISSVGFWIFLLLPVSLLPEQGVLSSVKQHVTTLGEGIWVPLGRQSPGRTWEIHTECGLGVCVCDIKESGAVLSSLPVGIQQAQGLTRHQPGLRSLHKWQRRKVSQGLFDKETYTILFCVCVWKHWHASAMPLQRMTQHQHSRWGNPPWTCRAATELFPSLHLTFNPVYYLRKHPLSTRCVPGMVQRQKGYRGRDSPILKELLVEACTAPVIYSWYGSRFHYKQDTCSYWECVRWNFKLNGQGAQCWQNESLWRRRV